MMITELKNPKDGSREVSIRPGVGDTEAQVLKQTKPYNGVVIVCRDEYAGKITLNEVLITFPK